MTIVNPVPPIGAYVPPYMPLDNITPFTYRDGMTYLQILHELRRYINLTIVPFVNTQFDTLGSDFATQVNALIDTVNTSITALENEVDSDITTLQGTVNTQLASNLTTVNTAVANLTTYVDQQVAIIQAEGIPITDPIIDAVVSSLTSATRVLLDSLYASKSAFTTTQGNVTTNAANIATVTADVANLKSDAAWYAHRHGVLTDGSDQSVNVNAFIAGATAAGAVAVFDRGTTVSIGSAINIPSNARINLNGATIYMLGNGTEFVGLLVSGVANVEIFGGTVNGNKAGYAAVSEHRHCISIINSTDVLVHDVATNSAKGDGVYIGDQIAGLSKRVRISRIIANDNWRNAMSISHASDVSVSDSVFSASVGTAPQAGVDIEPNVTTIACEDIRFTNCKFLGNTLGDGVRVSLQANPTARQAGIYFYGCVSSGNLNGYNIRDGLEVSIIGGSAESNLNYGINFDAGYGTLVRDVKIADVTVKNNARHGVNVNTTVQVVNISLINCTIRDNSTITPASYMGAYFNGLAGSSGIQVIGCYFDNVNQHYHLRTSANNANVTVIGNRFMPADPGGGTMLLQDDAVSRVQVDQYAVKGGSGTTAQRPGSGFVQQGAQYFDTTLGKPVWYTGTGTTWKDATGATV